MNEHISHVVNFEQANNQYNMTKTVRHFYNRKGNYKIQLSFGAQFQSFAANVAPP